MNPSVIPYLLFAPLLASMSIGVRRVATRRDESVTWA
jgi:hypothetical protein